MRTSALVVNPARVVHETVEGEVIIIQLERGNYYSLRGSGREIWELLCQGLSPAQITGRLEESYDAESGMIETAVGELVAQLREEALLEKSVGGATYDGRGGHKAPPGPSPGSGVPFTPSMLEKYTDMQDYLLLDPIHDVTEEGWPTLQPGQ